MKLGPLIRQLESLVDETKEEPEVFVQVLRSYLGCRRTMGAARGMVQPQETPLDLPMEVVIIGAK